MPIYEYICENCGKVHEELCLSRENKSQIILVNCDYPDGSNCEVVAPKMVGKANIYKANLKVSKCSSQRGYRIFMEK